LPAHVPEDFDARFAFDYDPLPAAMRGRLDDYFAPYNERLHALLGIDFGWSTVAEA
jgi:hypothetical protein